MSLNDVYRQRHTPTPKSKALDAISTIIRQHDERVGAGTRVATQVDYWRRILAGDLHPEQFINRNRADVINQHLRQSNFPSYESGVVPSEMALVEHRADLLKIPMTVGLLRALRDACRD